MAEISIFKYSEITIIVTVHLQLRQLQEQNFSRASQQGVLQSVCIPSSSELYPSFFYLQTVFLINNYCTFQRNQGCVAASDGLEGGSNCSRLKQDACTRLLELTHPEVFYQRHNGTKTLMTQDGRIH